LVPGAVDVVTGGEVMVPGGVLPADDDDAVVPAPGRAGVQTGELLLSP